MAKRRRVKVRITTWVDRDVLMWLKVRSLETRMGYQTLMNRMLQEAIALAAKEVKRQENAPPPVSRTEYESVLSTLKEMETRLEGLREAVRISQQAQISNTRGVGQRPPTKRGRKSRKPLQSKKSLGKKTKDQRRVSQNSTS